MAGKTKLPVDIILNIDILKNECKSTLPSPKLRKLIEMMDVHPLGTILV